MMPTTLWCWVVQGHTSREESRAAMQLKLFAFQFVNCFSSLFYIAFWLQVPPTTYHVPPSPLPGSRAAHPSSHLRVTHQSACPSGHGGGG